MSNTNTQVTPIKEYDTNKIMFSEPILGSIPDSKPKIEFKRINISTKNDDGSVGELILPTSRLFSFGVSENTSQETGKINGYTFPLCLWNKDGHSDEEKEFTDLFGKIVDKCIDHLVENKEEIDMFDLTRTELTKSKGGLNPLYWKKEKFKQQGFIFGSFLIMIFGARFFIEFVKIGQTARDFDWSLNTGQWLSIPFVLMGIYLIYRSSKNSSTQ